MKTVFSNAQCAHVWAQRNQEHGHSGAMHFDKDTIYSYDTPIAAFKESANGRFFVALVTSERYSNTTSGKHMPAVNRAISHYPTFCVPNLGIDRRGQYDHAPDKIHTENMAHYARLYAAELLSLSRAKIGAEERVSQLQRLATEAKYYANIFALPLEADYFPTNFPAPSEKELEEVKARAAKATAEKTKATAEKNKQARAELETAIKKLLAGDREALPWSWFRITSKEQKATIESYALDHWRKTGEGTKGVHMTSLPVELRLKDIKTIQTSHGAEFPVDEAIRAFPTIRLCKNKGMHVAYDDVEKGLLLGSFRIDEIDAEGNVTAGCHYVQYPVIERMASQLGLVA